jgi:hypothetical protein
MLRRLTDRIEKDASGEKVIRRFGMWGTNLELECREKQFFVVYPDGNEEKFKTKTEAEDYMKQSIGSK